MIRLFPDYGRDWPLWENSTPTWNVGYTTAPDMYGLSDELTARIAAWNEHWKSHFDEVEGFDSGESEDHWRVEGEAIAEALRHEVESFADVSYEPWPLQA